MATTYGLGGQELKQDTGGAGISDIPFNRTLFVQQLSDEEAFVPELTKGLRTVNDVFEHFKPSVEVAFEDEEGNATEEQINFRNLGDFGPKGIAAQSKYLASAANKEKQYNAIASGLKSKAALQAVMQKPELKAAFTGALRAMLAELEATT